MDRTRMLGYTWIVALLSLAGLVRAQSPTLFSAGQAALDSAARKQEYLFVLVQKQDDAPTQSMKKTLDDALAKQGGRASSIVVRANDPSEKQLIDRWDLSRTPMPIVLAVAPNGAITGGFPLKLTESDVAGAFVSPVTAVCLKATQARKLVLLCVLPASETQYPTGVKQFAVDPAYGSFTEVVAIRAGDPVEAGFVKSLKIDPATKQTITAMIFPPGSVVGSFNGEVTKTQLAETLKTAQTNCCAGGKCGPGGCCPAPAKK